MVKKAGEELEAFFKESWTKHDVDATAKLLSKEKKVLTKEDEMMKECDRIVHFLKKHKHAQPFLRPVTAEILQNSELWAKYQDVIDTVSQAKPTAQPPSHPFLPPLPSPCPSSLPLCLSVNLSLW